MLYNLLYPLAENFPILKQLEYMTFRSGGAFLTALFISFIFGSPMIKFMKRKQKEGQPIREDRPTTHFAKRGTPTMGGLLIIISIMFSTILWADISNQYIWVMIVSTLGHGLVGFIDDYKKVKDRDTAGLSGYIKIVLQTIIAIATVMWIQTIASDELNSHISMPFVKYLLDIGVMYIFFTAFVIIGTSNSVNLTDGLDGLSIVPTMISVICYGIIAYIVGYEKFSDYFSLYFVEGSAELVVFCAAFIGAGIGFLWFNAIPARIFMGDTGALAIGGALGTISVITKHELVLVIIGGLFVVEAISVMIQMTGLKLTGKKIFKMYPFHHHLEESGWQEATIVTRFWIIAFLLGMLGLATLKFR